MINCPYCGKKYSTLNQPHLKTHGKTIAQCQAEHPEIPKHFYPSSFKIIPSSFKKYEEADLYSIERNLKYVYR